MPAKSSKMLASDPRMRSRGVADRERPAGGQMSEIRPDIGQAPRPDGRGPVDSIDPKRAGAERLAGLPPEQRLAGLDRDHQALALPVEVLQLLPEEYLRSLSPEVEAEIRRRLHQRGR